MTDKEREAFEAMREALSRTTDFLDESHQYDRDSNHAGDGPEGCTYCEALTQARAALALADEIEK